MGGEDADLSSQSGNDDAEDPGRDSGEHGTSLEGAERYGIFEQTVWKWRNRDSVDDRSRTPYRLQTTLTLTPAQEAVAVSLRKTLLLPLDDLLSVVREFLNPNAFRSGLDRCLRRHRFGGINFPNGGGQEWVLWTALMEAGIEARQLPPAQIKAFAMPRGTKAKTDRIDAELIARFMMFRPEAGRALPGENLRVLRTSTTRRAQIVEMRKRLAAQMSARRKQGFPADIEDLGDALKAMLDAQFSDLERRFECAIASEQTSSTKAGLLRSIPGIGPVSAAMLVAG